MLLMMERVRIAKKSRALTTFAEALAQQLHMRHGKSVVVCNQPSILILPVQKAWLQHIRELQQELTCTSDEERIQQLTHTISWMQAQRFSARRDPGVLELLDADVVFATVAQLMHYAPACQVMYITCPITKEHLHLMSAWMPRSGTIITYTNQSR